MPDFENRLIPTKIIVKLENNQVRTNRGSVTDKTPRERKSSVSVSRALRSSSYVNVFYYISYFFTPLETASLNMEKTQVMLEVHCNTHVLGVPSPAVLPDPVDVMHFSRRSLVAW